MTEEKGVHRTHKNREREECIAQLMMNGKKYYRSYSVSRYGLEKAYFMACCSRWQFEYELKKIEFEDIIKHLIRHQKRIFYIDILITEQQEDLLVWYLEKHNYWCLFMGINNVYILDENYHYVAQYSNIAGFVRDVKEQIIEKIESI